MLSSTALFPNLAARRLPPGVEAQRCDQRSGQYGTKAPARAADDGIVHGRPGGDHVFHAGDEHEPIEHRDAEERDETDARGDGEREPSERERHDTPGHIRKPRHSTGGVV